MPYQRISPSRPEAARPVRTGMLAWAALVFLSACAASATPVLVGDGEAVEGPVSGWRPYFLYASDYAMFAPGALTPLARVLAGEAYITGLAAASSGNEVFYARSTAAASVLIRLVCEGSPRVICSADDLVHGSWFRSPMWVSPNHRWIVVSLGQEREHVIHQPIKTDTAADVWLVDATGVVSPRLIVPRSQVSSCQWSPSGRYVVYASELDGDVGPSVTLLDCETGESVAMANARGLFVWSLDGRRVRLYTHTDSSPRLYVHEVASGVTQLEPGALPPPVPLDAVPSNSGGVFAWLDKSGPVAALALLDEFGRRRAVPLPSPPRAILAWSNAGALLAVLTADNHVHFASGVTNDEGYESLMAVLPNPTPPPGELSLRQGISLETAETPILLEEHDAKLTAWSATDGHPRFLFVGRSDNGEETLYGVTFKRLSPLDFGVDPRRDMRKEIIRRGSLSNLRQVHGALIRYMQDHDGKLPEHAEGDELAEELSDYVPFPGVFGGPYSPDRMGVRLLMPGVNLSETVKRLSAEELSATPILELSSDDGCLFTMYLDGHEEWECP